MLQTFSRQRGRERAGKNVIFRNILAKFRSSGMEMETAGGTSEGGKKERRKERDSFPYCLKHFRHCIVAMLKG